MKEAKIETKKQQRIKFLNQYFNLVVVLVTLLVLAVVYFVFLKPALAKKELYNTTVIETKEMILTKNQKKKNELFKLESVYTEDINDYIKNKILEILPSEYDEANLYYNLEQIAKNNNYKLTNMVVEIPEKNLKKNSEKLIRGGGVKKIKEINISLELEGVGYLDFKNLLNDLEHNLRLFDVMSFDYSSQQKGLELNLKTYYYN